MTLRHNSIGIRMLWNCSIDNRRLSAASHYDTFTCRRGMAITFLSLATCDAACAFCGPQLQVLQSLAGTSQLAPSSEAHFCANCQLRTSCSTSSGSDTMPVFVSYTYPVIWCACISATVPLAAVLPHTSVSVLLNHCRVHGMPWLGLPESWQLRGHGKRHSHARIVQHDVSKADCVLERISRRSQRYILGKRIESDQMDALKSFISTRSLVILSRTSSLRGSALRLLSFRVRVQAQTQKATPQRARQNVVSRPGEYPISFRSLVYAMQWNLQENVLRSTLQHAAILSEAPWQCMNASFLLRIP